MADVNANIGVSIDTTEALAQLKALQRQISNFHTSIARSSEAAALSQRDLQKNFINSVNSIGAFSAELRAIKTSAESFTDSLEKNKFSMREYLRYSAGATRTFGRLFKEEFNTVNNVAEENVKRLQTQYIKMGRDANGVMKAIAIMPKELDMSNYTTQVQMAAQRQAIFNQLVRQGTTNLLNFGKNTQWAGRQLMVGFTLPLMALGTTASRTFMDMETAALKFRKVYGDLFTPTEEREQALADITALGEMFTKYGISVASTVGLAADAAAAGFQGLDLQRQVTEATRLSVLGQIDQQKALETTISLQNAFKLSNEALSDSINFLNAVENQTVVSLDDITTAIPKVAPVIMQLGGNVKDLAFFLTAMKQGGVNASEGANALKSGLASLINPTEKAAAMLADMGVNITNIVERNKGDLRATVVDFAKALDTLDPLARARAIEQLFGKFQFARLSTLFENVTSTGTQASRVLELAGYSVEELAATANSELGMTAESGMMKFRKAVEDLRLALVPVGETFLEAVTPIVEFIGDILEKFNNLSSGTKKAITILTVAIGAIGPVALMTFGLLANALANILKGANILRNGYLRLTGQSQMLGAQTEYLTVEQQNAAAVAHSLDQTHARLTQTFNAETGAVNQLIQAYKSAATAGANFARNNPGMMVPPRGRRGFADGIISVPGPKGAGDIVPAMLSPGEAVVPADMAKKYAPLIKGMIAGNIPGFQDGRIPIFPEFALRLQNRFENMRQQAGRTDVPSVLSNLAMRVGEARGITPTQSRVSRGEFDPVVKEYEQITTKFVNQLNKDFDETFKDIKDSNDRFARSWMSAGRSVEEEVNKIASDAERGAVRKVFGLDPDVYGTIPTAPRKAGGTVPERARRSAFLGGTRSYTSLRGGVKSLYERMTGQSAAELQMGHVFKPQTIDIAKLQSDPRASSAVRSAAKVMSQQGAQVADQAIRSTAMAAQTASPSKRTIPIGEDIARGLQVGMANQTDETAAAGSNLANAAISGTQSGRRGARRATRPQGPPGMPMSQVAAGAAVNAQVAQKVNQKLTDTTGRLDRLNGRFMAGMFALTSFAGAASFAGGGLGKFGEIIFQISGPMFALSSVIQMLTGTKILGLISKFKFAFGAASLALVGGIAIIKAVNSAREKERMSIEGLGDAASLSADKLKTLGDIFGVVPTRTPFESTRARIPVAGAQRAEIEKLKENEDFQKTFGKDIEALKAATNEQAEIIFDSLAIQLRGKGFAKEQINSIVQALQEESGKIKVRFNFDRIDLTSAQGMGNLKNTVEQLSSDLGKEFSTGYSERINSAISRATGQTVTWTTQTLSKGLKRSIDTTSKAFTSMINGISGQFAIGSINAQQFGDAFSLISQKIESMPKPQALLIMKNLVKGLPEELQKSAEQIENVADQMLLLKAQALGVAVSAQVIQAMAVMNNPLASFGKIGAMQTIERFKKQIADALKLTEEFNKELNGTGTGTKKGPTAKERFDKAYSIIKNFFDSQEALIRQQRKSEAQLLQTKIENAQIAVDKAQKEIDAKEEIIDANNREIDLLKRRIELEFDRPINKLQDESSILSNNLEIISQQEKAINDQYDTQIKSLEKISSVNQEIANREKSRLSIADALTSGNIAEAAQAVQEARAQAAAASIEQQRGSLDAARQQALGGITAGGMTRDQIEARQYQISQQIFAIEQQRKALQDQIVLIEDRNYAVEQQIYKLKQDSLIPSQESLDKAEAALDAYNKTTDKIVESIKYLGQTAEEWENNRIKVEAQNSQLKFTRDILKEAKTSAQQIFEAWDKIKSKVITIETRYVTSTSGSSTSNSKSVSSLFKMYGGKVMAMNMGGMVPEYFASGGRIGSDSVPAMLTPGEFVVNKNATKSFGPMLSAINDSKYPSMIKSRMATPQYSVPVAQNSFSMPSNTAISSVNDNSNTVYNYNVGITVGGTNVSPNNIAKTVMNEIRYLDAQRIRGQKAV